VGTPDPQPITLTAKERVLLAKISFDLSGHHDAETVRAWCDSAKSLAQSLLKRKAVPEIRLRYFTDPDLNVGGHNKSRKEVFEGNGTRGDDILQHPHFLAYLKYFIFGPDLPQTTIDQFRQIVIEDRGTSGMLLKQMTQFARAETRRLGENRPDEFFKLALECGLDVGLARIIRDAVRGTR
jgi:hypothetical protein